MLNNAAHVTISLLPVSLSLIHIPRSRLTELSRPVLKQILQTQSPFLNLTCNEIELSIFAEEAALEDFEPIARKDRLKIRKRDRADSTTSSASRGHRRRPTSGQVCPVETSFEKWNVLQIDSHEDSVVESSGARVRELSAPLAAAGISILYQSSYMSDFIFVKAARLSEVMALLASAGFGLYSSDPHNLTSQMSPLLSPTASDDSGSVMFDLSSQDDVRQGIHAHAHAISSESGAVLSRTRSPSLASLASLSFSIYHPPLEEQENVPSDELFSTGEPQLSTSISPQSDSTIASGLSIDTMTAENPNFNVLTQPTPRLRIKKSLSPTSAPVHVLPTDLACVGLNDASIDVWTTKILKLVSYPELILSASKSITSANSTKHSPRLTRDDAYIHSNLSSDMFERDSKSVSRDLHVHQRWFPSDESCDDFESRSPASSPYSSGSEDEYFSSSPPYASHGGDSPATPSLVSGWSSSSRSLPDLELTSTLSAKLGRRSDHLITESNERRPRVNRLSTDLSVDTVHALDDTEGEKETFDASFGTSTAKAQRSFTFANGTTTLPDAGGVSVPSQVPFFSFTRTQEGSSLTTDVRILAALFQSHERHMVICREELLEAADRRRETEAAGMRARTDASRDGGVFEMEVEAADEDEDEDALDDECTLRCLQIDLRKFGLDKHGLVNRFSRVLEENGINHMYSSTYKTANLLVDRANAVRAQSLLRSC